MCLCADRHPFEALAGASLAPVSCPHLDAVLPVSGSLLPQKHKGRLTPSKCSTLVVLERSSVGSAAVVAANTAADAHPPQTGVFRHPYTPGRAVVGVECAVCVISALTRQSTDLGDCC